MGTQWIFSDGQASLGVGTFPETTPGPCQLGLPQPTKVPGGNKDP